MSSLWIRVAYSAMLALVVSLTLGFGVAMVYAGPKQPDTPAFTFQQIQSGGENQQDADRIVKAVDRFYQDAYDFRRAYPDYQRNMFLALTLCAIIVGAVGLALPPVMNYLRLGLTLGAILLLVVAANLALSRAPNPAPTNGSSITNLLGAGSPPGLDFAGRFLRFAVSFIGLLVLLFMGIWRLTDWAPRTTPESSRFASPAAPTVGARDDAREESREPVLQVRSEPSPEQLQWRRPQED